MIAVVKTKKEAESFNKPYLRISSTKYLVFNSVSEMVAYNKKL